MINATRPGPTAAAAAVVGHSNEETCGETSGTLGEAVICVAVAHTKRQQSIQNGSAQSLLPRFRARAGTLIVIFLIFLVAFGFKSVDSRAENDGPSGGWLPRASPESRPFIPLASPASFSAGESSGSRARQRRGSLTIGRELATGENESESRLSRVARVQVVLHCSSRAADRAQPASDQ